MVSKKILVVDDEYIIRDLLEYSLGKAGYSVCSATSGEGALEILKQESIPVMFIDLGLDIDAMTGFKLCEQIRKEHPNAIIYALTGYAKLFDPQEFHNAGFDDFFTKPIDIQAIYQVLRDVFAKMDPQNVIERILIIDDDDQFREMLCEMLELEGYAILEASDGEQGIKRQSEQPADLIIVDVIMPGKDGLDTMLDIKDAFPEAKFIMISGETGYVAEAKLCMTQILGARILRKPFSRKQILEVIEQLQN